METQSTSKSVPAHTPGPWRQSRLDIDEIVHGEYGEDGVYVATVKYSRGDISDAECEANARLISAAPEMAEALLWIRENLHPQALGRGATAAELYAITWATKALRTAGVIPTPNLAESQP